jgi:hypothetical protein
MNELSKAAGKMIELGTISNTGVVPANGCFRSPIQSRIGIRNPMKEISKDERLKRRKKKKEAAESQKRNRN